MLLCTFGYAVNAFGVYQDFYSTSFLAEASNSQISWVGSSILLLQNFAGLFAGRLFDQHLFNFLLIPGTLLYVIWCADDLRAGPSNDCMQLVHALARKTRAVLSGFANSRLVYRATAQLSDNNVKGLARV